MMKTGKTLIDLVRVRLGGLPAKKLTSNERGPSMTQGLERRSASRHNILKPSKESNTPPRPWGLHPAGALTRTHRKSNDATTPVHDSLSLYKSNHTHTKAQGLLLGT
jgi:hypothetical protein